MILPSIIPPQKIYPSPTSTTHKTSSVSSPSTTHISNNRGSQNLPVLRGKSPAPISAWQFGIELAEMLLEQVEKESANPEYKLAKVINLGCGYYVVRRVRTNSII